MSDFTSSFWSFYVAIVTLVSIVACGVLLWLMGRMRVAGKPASTASNTPGQPEVTGHVWDEDLAEYNNPLPRWWMWLFYATIVFGVAYLILYPGLGKAPGVLGWTSANAYAIDVKAFDDKVAPVYAKYMAMEAKDVAADPQARAMGERLFLNYCAQCHGSDAGGSKGFPNLRDTDWLYGGDPEAIKASIADGRNGIMPPWSAVLGEEGVKELSNYVRSLSGITHDSLGAQLGKPLYMRNCAACHGADGKGMHALGAPNLTDAIWLWGGSNAAIAESIAQGRGSPGAVTRMPAHKDLLDPGKIHLLTAYVWGLSNAKTAVAK